MAGTTGTTHERARRLLKGQYELRELVGEGGLAWVFAAKNHSDGKTVAVKVLRPDVVRSNPETVSRFEREADVLGRLKHPNIVQLYDQGHHLGLYFIVLELVDGYTLRQHIEHGGQLPVNRALLVARQVASALRGAEALGVVHRDIKPQNVILDRYHWAKLTDFGIASILSVSHITSTGKILGTPQYLSPEQAMGQPVDIRSDIYSLGATIYEALTGAALVKGDNPAAVIHCLLNQAPASVSGSRNDVPRDLLNAVDAVLARCLAKDCRQRYQSAQDLLAAIDDLLLQTVDDEPESNRILHNLLAQVASGQKTGRKQVTTPSQPFGIDLSTPDRGVAEAYRSTRNAGGNDVSDWTRDGKPVRRSDRVPRQATITIRSSDSGSRPRTVAIGTAGVRIGRTDARRQILPDIDLTPENKDRTVHRRHARITYRMGTWYVEAEPGAEKDTSVNGQPVIMDQPVPLRTGDRIRLSRSVELTFTIGS